MEKFQAIRVFKPSPILFELEKVGSKALSAPTTRKMEPKEIMRNSLKMKNECHCSIKKTNAKYSKGMMQKSEKNWKI